MNLKDLMKNVAPRIASTIGSPAGGVAVKFLCEKLLGNPNASEEELATVIGSASPAQLLELKRLDREFEISMEALNLNREKWTFSDRQKARTILKTIIWPQVLLTFTFVVGYFIIVGLLVANHDIHFSDKMFGIFTTILGVLTAVIPTIVQFWFGSSSGSKDKDKKLEHKI
ncbi:MAG: hypothetical protein MI742_01605 [Desulfobacterales bacterium]|nr:hypothetical protein [Desulfobacterales bacterium]